MVKWIVAGLTGLFLMLAMTDPALRELKKHFEVQQILTAMFLVALPVQAWCGSQSESKMSRI